MEIYEVALLLKITPDEVRQMTLKDVRWVKLVSQAQNLAFGPNFD